MKTVQVDNFIQLFTEETDHITTPDGNLTVGQTVFLIDENHTDWTAVAEIQEKAVTSPKTACQDEKEYRYKVKISTFCF